VNRVDLHIHSTASDGKFTPAQIIKQAVAIGLEYIALTDHDSVDGIVPAMEEARKYPRLFFIPGVEISTDVSEGEIHILGYFIDYLSRDLHNSLEKFRTSRQGRAKAMVERLGEMGMNIDWSRVQEIAGDGAIGRPHIAEAMLEKGYIQSFKEAFDKYIGHGGPAYVDRFKMSPQEAVALVIRSGGLPVLAHPFTVKNPEAWVPILKAVGLVGIEAYYKDNTSENTQATINLVEKYGLIVTGGTDFHGLDDNREVMLGGVPVPVSAARHLIAAAGKSK
jgi:predicted metal-dependent phosphoesterase TrpH